MCRHWSYLKYVVRHKVFVLRAILQYLAKVDTTVKVQLLWRGIWHDKDKFYPDEWFPYARFFYNPDGSKVEKIRDSTGYYKAAETGNKPFDFAWLLHQKRNDHHWQWWVLPLDDGGIKTLDMSSIARIEMVCDWRGAGSAQGFPKTWEWYAKNRNNMQLHPETRTWIEDQLYKQALTQDGIEAANIFYSTIHEGA